jgi:hypothetical protein
MANGDIAKGFVLGVVAVLIGRTVLKSLPSVGGGQPITRALLRSGSVLAEKAREAAAELGEVLDDALAELHAAATSPAARTEGQAPVPTDAPPPP